MHGTKIVEVEDSGFNEDKIDSDETLLGEKDISNDSDEALNKRCSFNNICNKKCLKKNFPISLWLPGYNLNTLRCDIIAGLTVGLTVIPQALAYAAIAGLPIQYGLYSSFMGCFIYCFLGTSKDITLGPTAIMSILIAEYAKDPWYQGDGEKSSIELAILLSLVSGALQLLMGVVRLGEIVNFISHPVISGFTSAASVVIGGGQIKKMLGVTIPHSENFFSMMYNTFKYIGETRIWDLVLGILCIISLFLLKLLKEKTTYPLKKTSVLKTTLYKIAWFVGTARNAVVVIFTSLVAYLVTDISLPKEEQPFTLTPETSGGLPPFRAPYLSMYVPSINETIGLVDMLYEIRSGIVVVSLMGLLESIAIATAFARKNEYKINATQELIALGVSNVAGSFVSSYPITGSFSRTAVNSQSNVATPAGGIFTGTLVLMSLAFVSTAFRYIPSSALAAVIIMAVVNMLDVKTARTAFKVNKTDCIPMFFTFVLSFWDLAYGIIAGIAISLVILLLPHTRPGLHETSKQCKYVSVAIKHGLDFPGTSSFEKQLYKVAMRNDCSCIILDCSHIVVLDYSAVEALKYCYQRLDKDGISIKLVNLNKKHQRKLVGIGIPRNQLSFYPNEDAAKSDLNDKELDKISVV